MSKKSFIVDAEKCSGCGLCVVSCKDEHVGSTYAPWSAPQPETGHFWVNIKAIERGVQPRVQMNYLPMLCQHCEDAPCMKVCDDDAIQRRDDGLVWIDAERCSGCGLCAPACPYDVIFKNEQLGIAQKCNACAHRVDAGELPRCVEVCPHEAILFGDENSAPIQEAQRSGSEVLHPEYQTAPRVLWKGLPKPWIAGTLVDPQSDDCLDGVTVQVRNLFDDSAQQVRSDSFGDFRLSNLQSDAKYLIIMEKSGYRSERRVVTTAGDQDLGSVSLQRLG